MIQHIKTTTTTTETTVHKIEYKSVLFGLIKYKTKKLIQSKVDYKVNQIELN
jgi:hypothetical protein